MIEITEQVTIQMLNVRYQHLVDLYKVQMLKNVLQSNKQYSQNNGYRNIQNKPPKVINY